jgi:hypothetical protein
LDFDSSGDFAWIECLHAPDVLLGQLLKRADEHQDFEARKLISDLPVDDSEETG